MTPSLDQWEKDLFFRVAEEVQESAVNNRTIRVASFLTDERSKAGRREVSDSFVD
ncbi:hypothetical protein F2Q70_00040508 [Brassica cretica]|uniref:Uncharacterized protein n=1 Tax=Brassica cretica TaxID=69181 RepID=A0A8S9K5U8_BRACR|nr:hypothetical protein F2Q70_00040508 [Brassica cretica]